MIMSESDSDRTHTENEVETVSADGERTSVVVVKPGQKLLIDVEENKVEVSDLTAEEAHAIRADWGARLAALQQRWETSRDREALLGALIFCQLQLPEWLFKGVMETFAELTRDPNETRFLAVRYAHDVRGMTMDEAYEWASDTVTDPAARGGRDTMMKSYQKISSKVAKIDRIKPRSRTHPRRG